MEHTQHVVWKPGCCHGLCWLGVISAAFFFSLQKLYMGSSTTTFANMRCLMLFFRLWPSTMVY